MRKNNSYGLRRNVLRELNQGFSCIHENFKYFRKLTKENTKVIGAAEWLLDNIYLIEKEYKAIKKEMPIDYFNSLPSMEKFKNYQYKITTSFKNKNFDEEKDFEKENYIKYENDLPRIFVVAKNYINVEGNIDSESFIEYINKIQEENLGVNLNCNNISEKLFSKIDSNKINKDMAFTMGELWAFPLMLKTAIIINLSQYTNELVDIQKQILQGKFVAERIVDAISTNKLDEELESINNKYEEFSPLSLREFFKVLRNNSIENKSIYDFVKLKWKIDQELDNYIIKSNLREKFLERHIGEYITSIRKIEGISWRNFFQNTSLVDRILREDPENVYENMDFESKDYYRHKLENIAKIIDNNEINIAHNVLKLALKNKKENKEPYKCHVGYYLIDNGMSQLEGYHHNVNNVISEGAYLSINILGTFIISVFFLFIFNLGGVKYTKVEYIISFLLILIPINEIIIGLTNWIVTKTVDIRLVPKIDFSKGLPDECKTIVVIPAIVNCKEKVKSLMEKLEIAYCGNKDKNLYFALLSDFEDLDSEVGEKDKEIIKCGLECARKLNNKYCKDNYQDKNNEERFFFFSRKRLYNKKQNVFMGKERKRGKLMEFMALIRGRTDHTYNVLSSDISPIKNVKYLITLDEDTFMPRESSFKLIGAMSHVLNTPYVKDNRVIRGYGIMQPKVSISLEAQNQSYFSKIFGGEGGVDGYSVAYSDTYQDLFGQGSFTGKGIINIDEFYNTLHPLIKDNRILSHDLLEGAIARCALISQVEFIDGYPAFYESSCRRLHRWVRGDWQLIGWLFSNKISSLNKWKIFDNLRRSLLAPNLLIALILSLTVLHGRSQIALVCFLAIMNSLVFTVTDFVVTPKNRLMGTFKSFQQILLIFSFIPYQAFLMIDAIIRTLFRLCISKRNLLEWQSFDSVEKKYSNNSLKAYLKRMWIAPIMGLLVLYLSIYNPIGAIMYSAVVGGLWIISPYLAYRISKINSKDKMILDDEENVYLRKISRRTYAYYQDFVNEENNYLAPDNYQEKPFKGIAHRTSPTNIGMGLIANVVAYDLGYITMMEFVDKTEMILSSMKSLQMVNGHYLNWYDTKTKAPLWPRYVSTVDSGNLLGNLWVLKQAMEELKDKEVIRINEIISLRDIYALIEKEKPLIEVMFNSNINIGKYNETLNKILDKIKDFTEIDKEHIDNKDKTHLQKKMNQEDKYWLNKFFEEVNNKLKCYNYIFNGLEKLYSKEFFEGVPSIRELIDKCEEHKNEFGDDFNNTLVQKIDKLKIYFKKIDNIIKDINMISENMDFNFLYDKSRQLFFIGYNVEDNSLGNSYYDLLASESRIASFISVAKNDVPTSHWFKLGRSMTNAFHTHALVSWSGTMFEYFMPALIMRNYPKTLLSQTYRSVIKAQKNFSKQKKTPWGISECAFYKFDVDENYQYKAFGIPGIGLKRGLEDEIVISPYSTLMTLPFSKRSGIENLRKLEKIGCIGRYGFIEAVDYTKAREDKYVIKNKIDNDDNKSDIGNSDNKHIEDNIYSDGIKPNKVMTYMVHHLGMSLMALDNVLLDNILINRFHSLPEVKATELVLKEKIPHSVTFERNDDFSVKNMYFEGENLIPRNFKNVNQDNPEVLLLSNGEYSSMLTVAGSGYSKKNDMMLYRWKGNSTSDDSGMFFYIKNLNSNDYWSSTFEPCKDYGDSYVTEFNLDKAKFNRKDGNIETQMEVVVSPDENFEVRKITLTNLSDKGRSLEITSYMEITLTTFSADAVHPAFSNLFVQTEYDDKENVLIGSRRGRVKGAKVPYIFHKVIVNGELEGNISYETSRINFIGRNRELKLPLAMDNDKALNNTVGTVLDPIMSIRARIRLDGNSKKELYFITGTTDSKEAAINICKQNRDVGNLEKVFESYSIRTQLELKNLAIRSAQANMFQTLASYIFFLHSGRRDREEYIKNISKHQKDLWSYGISGDLPIVFLTIEHDEDINLVSNILNLHYYLKLKGVKLDLIIYNNEEISYDEPLQKEIMQAIHLSKERNSLNTPGGIFVHNKSTMDLKIKDFIIGIARLYVDSKRGSMLEQITKSEEIKLNNINEFSRYKKSVDEESYKRNHTTVVNDNNIEEIYIPKKKKDTKGKSNKKKESKKLENEAKSLNINYKLEIGDELIQKLDDNIIEYKQYDHDEDFLEEEDLVRGSESKGIKDDISKLMNKKDFNTENFDEDFNMEDLDFFNGYGGFSKIDNSYLIKLSNFKNTPAPWINVVSNDDFGFHISESGSSYTWCGNSRENKITPWSNDYIRDPIGEALYIRDDNSYNYFSITPKPVRDKGDYFIKHGFGYSEFTHTAYDLKGKLEIFAPKNEKVKIQKVTLENLSEDDREISLFYYAKLVMGVYEYDSSRYVSTYIHGNVEKNDKLNVNEENNVPNSARYIYNSGFIRGCNPYSQYFGKYNSYLTILGGECLSFTGDSKEFIGINGEVSAPKALNYEALPNRCGGIYDPCLAVTTKIQLKKGEKKELLILFGEEEKENIEKVIEKYEIKGNAEKELDNVKVYWKNFLGNIQVNTPDKSFNYLVNGWLLYQTLSCRYLSRSAFYQSGGAYGFRDQLQDSMALGVVDPEIPKAQILRSASRQYVEGDVQHWWHPVVNSGIRTRFSDDLLWLPYVTAEYINSTGDYEILQETAPYLEDEPLREGEDERYTIVNQSSKEGTVYEHCLKAIEKALKFGVHNIPLMGSGDWNDGMSTVGNQGKGESVWLGWFLYSILENFIKIAEAKGDEKTKTHYEERKEFIRENLEKNAWDGGWYRRAYFDDGTPLGSRENPECQIDSLAQSWSIISGATEIKSENGLKTYSERAFEAMEAVDKNLVKQDKGLILLLAPPFSNSYLEPGYIKGYVPGVRENGGQYTHAAVWVILALTKLGLGDKALKYYNMINPINHTKTELECMTYKLEPYVMAADVYIKEPHGGRGGWSWYTGASGWMYRVGIEDILGLKRVEDKGYILNPCIPKSWNEFEIKIKNDKEDYNIKVIRGENIDKGKNSNVVVKSEIKEDKSHITINGEKINGNIIPRNLGKIDVVVYI